MIQKYPHLIHPNYRPDIDGLRAIAVMTVVGYHAFPGRIHAGFIGVDIFFIISGYLISSIIFSSLERERFSLIEFYVRRIRRIFPSLIIVMLATFAIGWYVLLADEFAQLGKHMAGGAGFVSNFVLWAESGYFDREAASKPLLHLWSLGVEEQFYIFWPLLLAFVWKKHWSFLRITALIAVISFAVNVYLINTDPVASFYSPVSRFWELMAGGTLAYITLHRPQMISGYKNVQSVLGFILIGLALLLLEKSSAFPGWWALLPAMGAFFIISAGSGAWLNQTLLSGRVMIWIGLISYPLYLWHWPLLSFADILENGVVNRNIRISVVILAVLLAWLTYHFIERPVRFGRRKVMIVWMLSMIMSGIFIAGILVDRGNIAARNDNVSLGNIIAATKDWDYPGSLALFDPSIKGAYVFKSEKPEITLFMGDSHVEQYVSRVVWNIQKQPSESNSAVFVTDGGCVFIPGVYEDSPIHRRCGAIRDSALKFARSNEVKTIVVGGAWNSYLYYLNHAGGEVNSKGYHYYILDQGSRVSLSGRHGVALALSHLEAFLKSLSKTKKVYLLLDSPSGAQYDPHMFFSGSRLAGYTANSKIATTPVQADPNQAAIHDALVRMAERLGIDVIDPVPILCRGGLCMRSQNGQPVYMDANHLRASFVREYAVFIDKSLHIQ